MRVFAKILFCMRVFIINGFPMEEKGFVVRVVAQGARHRDAVKDEI